MSDNKHGIDVRQATHTTVVGPPFDPLGVHARPTVRFERPTSARERPASSDDAEGRVAAADGTADCQTLAASLVTLSHELRTPMHSILGLTEDLMSSSWTAEQQSLLVRVRANAAFIGRLLDDFLDIARLESGVEVASRESFDPRLLLAQCVSLFETAAERKGLELSGRVGVDVPSILEGDPARLAQVLTNLVGNAIKYTRKGRVLVSIACSKEHGTEELELSVEDSGIGLAPDDLSRVFDTFVRVGDVREHAGTGLGLSIVKAVVMSAGGRVHAESVLGVGSKFVAALPVHASSSELDSARYAQKTIAVVVASDSEREHIAALLRRFTTHVVTAASWAQVEALAPFDCDAVVLDADISDLASVVSSRAKSRWASVPILALVPRRKACAEILAALCVREILIRRTSDAYLLAALDEAFGSRAGTPVSGEGRPAGTTVHAVHPTALLVEDDADNRQLLRRALTRLGFATTVVDDGEHGLSRAKAFAYDVIVTDVMMPRMSGPSMTAAIRAHEVRAGRKPVPVIAVSASAFDATRSECMRAGMTEFLRKPLVSAELASALVRTVDSRPILLCVDDVADVRNLVVRFLQGQDVRIIEAENVRQARARAEGERVDAVLLDLELADGSGFELAEWFRSTAAHVNTPIIAVTGHDDPRVHRRCMEVGFTDILVKPYDRASLIRLVERHLIGAPRPRVENTATAEHPVEQVPDPHAVYVDADVVDLVPRFIDNRKADVSTLRVALERGDMETIRRLGHSMRGSGGGYGFHAITRMGADLELNGRVGDRDRIVRLIEELSDYLEFVRVEVAVQGEPQVASRRA